MFMPTVDWRETKGLILYINSLYFVVIWYMGVKCNTILPERNHYDNVSIV